MATRQHSQPFRHENKIYISLKWGRKKIFFEVYFHRSKQIAEWPPGFTRLFQVVQIVSGFLEGTVSKKTLKSKRLFVLSMLGMDSWQLSMEFYVSCGKGSLSVLPLCHIMSARRRASDAVMMTTAQCGSFLLNSTTSGITSSFL